MQRNTNRSSSTVDVLSGIYKNNCFALYIIATDTVTIASNTFIHNFEFSTNVIANTVSITCATFELGVSIISRAYVVSVSSITFVSNPLQIDTESQNHHFTYQIHIFIRVQSVSTLMVFLNAQE